MARQSAESLSVATVSIPVRPDPPKDLTSYQQEIWRTIVDTKPPEWFQSDTFPILRAYCTAAERHKKIAEKLDKIGIDDDESKDLMRAEDMYAKQLKALGVSMRLTQQSRYTPLSASTADKKKKPGASPWAS